MTVVHEKSLALHSGRHTGLGLAARLVLRVSTGGSVNYEDASTCLHTAGSINAAGVPRLPCKTAAPSGGADPRNQAQANRHEHADLKSVAVSV